MISLSLHTLSQTGSNVSQIACKISTLAMAPSLLEVPATLRHPHCHEAAPSLAVLGMTTTAPSMVQRVPRLAILTTHYLQRWATFGTIWFYHFVYVSTSCCNDTYYICHHIHTYLLTYVTIPCKNQVKIIPSHISYCWTSVKGGAHTHFRDAWISNNFMKFVWALPLTEVRIYAAMWPKFMTELHGTAKYYLQL